MSTKKGDFEIFLQRIEFPGLTVNFFLKHITNILKAINLKVHLLFLGTLYVHPVTCQIFVTSWFGTGRISYHKLFSNLLMRLAWLFCFGLIESQQRIFCFLTKYLCHKICDRGRAQSKFQQFKNLQSLVGKRGCGINTNFQKNLSGHICWKWSLKFLLQLRVYIMCSLFFRRLCRVSLCSIRTLVLVYKPAKSKCCTTGESLSVA